MRLAGEHTRPACRRRRPGDDFGPDPFKSLKGDCQGEGQKCPASRRAQPAGSLRSPFRSHEWLSQFQNPEAAHVSRL
jgi:hypothetical protein